ncbi:MAG: nitroreductase family protein [Promethearchaeota archaeon]|jgi:nitroreductase
MFTKPITNIIQERTSWRTYTGEVLRSDKRDAIIKIIKKNNFESPFSDFAGKIRFKLLSIPEFDPSEKKKLGTYGTIEGAQDFIVGAVERSKYDREHFGYILESIILVATDLGLGTVWLGGTFNRSLFSAKINKKENEIIPAITPIGYPAARTSREMKIRSYGKADKRFPWNKLFFDKDFSTPLSQKSLGEYSTIIEMVRLGPSAGNFQPWRIVKDSDSHTYHFYILYAKDKIGLMYKVFKPLDIGIAICHFNLTTKELGITGKWRFEEPKISKPEDLSYVISWCGDS